MTAWVTGQRCQIVEHDPAARKPLDGGPVIPAVVKAVMGPIVEVQAEGTGLLTFYAESGWHMAGPVLPNEEFRWRLRPAGQRDDSGPGQPGGIATARNPGRAASGQMNETVMFGEIAIIPLADTWEPPQVAGCRLPVLPLVGEGLTIGPEPGYSAGSDGPFGALPYPDAGDQRNLAVIVAWAPVEISHVYYGKTVVPPGKWRLHLRQGGAAPEEH